MNRLALAISAMNQLGFQPIWHLARYQFGLRSGFTARRIRKACSLAAAQSSGLSLKLDFPLPPSIMCDTFEAEGIASGQVQLFGGDPVPLDISPLEPLAEWTAYETGKRNWGTEDPKFIWEPARFGWAFTLARAYLSTHNDLWPSIFWQRFEEFSNANPPLMGPNWTSCQEVALRLMALCFAARVFADSIESTPDRLHAICQAISIHAARIPYTLDYARSQGNNHLLSEAAGLYTAAQFLPNHPSAYHWRQLGWQTYHQGIQKLIAPDGTFAQHSLNYHRLMLELSLWMHFLGLQANESFPTQSLERLSAASRWLFSLTDLQTGQAPNLGSNDGAHFLPLSDCDDLDMRPTLQAASLAFLGAPCLTAGPWDELSQWLALTDGTKPPTRLEPSPAILSLESSCARGFLRAVHFVSRPNQADQLHCDLWFDGQPITLDAGTYRYSAPDPWNNSLAGSLCHNTLTIDGLNQMRRAGKFLWLDWAQAKLLPSPNDRTLVAETDAYHQLGFTHRRTLEMQTDLNWRVSDEIFPAQANQTAHSFVLHWLLPDVPYESQENTFSFTFPFGLAKLKFLSADAHAFSLQLIRAGQILAGRGDFPKYLGWFSPTYNHKIPALSIRLIIQGLAPLQLESNWAIQPSLV